MDDFIVRAVRRISSAGIGQAKHNVVVDDSILA